MTTTMKRCFAAALMTFALCLGMALPGQALAAAGDATATVELKLQEGAPNKVDVYMTTNQVDARTFNLALEVKTDKPEYVDPVFDWNKADLDDADKPGLLWDEDTKTADGYRVSLYAGDLVREPFKDAARASEGKQVRLGTLVLNATSAAPKDQDVYATVQVAPGDDSLAFANYREAQRDVTAANLNATDPVRATVVAAAASSSSSSSSSQSEKDTDKEPVADAQKNKDILGETPGTNGKNLPSTGDQMMPVAITLVCVAVLAVVVIVVLAMRRKKTSTVVGDTESDADKK